MKRKQDYYYSFSHLKTSVACKVMLILYINTTVIFHLHNRGEMDSTSNLKIPFRSTLREERDSVFSIFHLFSFNFREAATGFCPKSFG